MDADRWRLIEELFKTGAGLSPEERAELLDRRCAGDPELRLEVEQLIELDRRDDAPLTDVVEEAAHRTVADDDPGPPERVGRYRIKSELGTGGMGSVYLAVRDDDTYSKEVALKLLREGLRGPDLVRRFKSERQILAALEHPNIARLLDGGTTGGGEPYLVMELIDGRPIDQYCDEAGLDMRARLKLFCKVCSAVQYAHDRSIVHRDIKPSNVLVGADGEPKLLDFGIAKLLDPGQLGVTTAETATSMRLMTPRYASPEQVRGEVPTPLTDIYALGVLLYEMLSGRRPYRIPEGGALQIERAVCEQEPERPSRAVTRDLAAASPTTATSEAIATARDATPTQLRRAISGDIDTIVLTALSKEPERRYGSAGELAGDLQRHLDGLPIRARPATLGYRVSKYLRRKPIHAALWVTLSVAFVAVAGLAVTTVQQRATARMKAIETHLVQARWTEERRQFTASLGHAEAILALDGDHLQGLRHLAVAGAFLGRGEEARDAARRAVELSANAAWTHALAAFVFEKLDLPGDAEEARRRGESLRDAEPTDEDLDFGGRMALARRDFETAITLFGELIERRPDRASAISARAYAFEETGDAARAFQEYRVAVGIDPTQNLTFVDLARLSIDRGELDEAEAFLDRSLALDDRGGFAHETRGHLLLQRGFRAAATGRDDDALQSHMASEEASRFALELDPSLRFARVNIATALLARYRLSGEGESGLLDSAMESYRETFSRWETPPEHGEERELFLTAISNYCDGLIQLERYEDALVTCERVTRLFPTNAVAFYNLAGVYALTGRPEKAIEALRRDLELGDIDWEYLEGDDWFAALRERDDFREILARMRAAATG